ncbi:MAG: glycosyltransferase family 39 protein [Armatimonadetes bacterium]|nr:glycosyltransferase family 39 protein [Armatimonadota bacterium]
MNIFHHRFTQPSIWLLVLICFFTFFWRLGSVPLFDLDEGLYVSCSRQMVLSGDYITPRLNTHQSAPPYTSPTPFFEKPIMVYWLSAGAQRLLGVTEWAARLPVALLSLFTTLLVAYMGACWFGRRAGFLAGVLYAIAPMTIADSRQMTTDAILVFWFLLTFFAFTRLMGIGKIPELSSKQRWGYVALFWFGIASALLTKGAVAILLPGLIISIFLGMTTNGQGIKKWRQVWHRLNSLKIVFGVTFLFLLAAPWHLAIAQHAERDMDGRTFIQEYVIRQHIGRFRGGDKVHNAPPYTYIGYFLMGFFPWGSFAPVAFRRRLPTEVQDPQEADSHLFLLIWFWTIFVFFTLSAAKLPTYIVPIYPAAALLLGRWFNCSLEGGADRALLGGTFLAVFVTVGMRVLVERSPRFARPGNPIPIDILTLGRHATDILMVGSILACFCLLWLKRTHHARRLGIAIMAVTMFLFTGLFVTEGYAFLGRDVLGPYQRLAQRANTLAGQGTPVVYYQVDPRRPSMLYYATYAPYERKQRPLSPLLLPLLLQNPKTGVLVITKESEYNKHLLAEIGGQAELNMKLVAHDGVGQEGWVLAHITLKNGRL